MKHSLASLFRSYLDTHPAKHNLYLDFNGCGIHVRSNSEELIAKLSSYFREFLGNNQRSAITIHLLECPPQNPTNIDLTFTPKAPELGKNKIKEEFADLEDGRIVRKPLTGMLFLFGRDQNMALGPCLENTNQAINFINNRYIAWELDQRSLLLHAAGVALQGKGLALAGFSGMGKSTLALHIMALGTDFVSNDRLMIKRLEQNLVMFGVAKMPRVNPGTIINNPLLDSVISPEERRLMAALPAKEIWSLEHKHDVFIDDCFGKGRFKMKAEMAGLILLNWSLDSLEPLHMQPVDIHQRPDLLPAFIKEPGLFYGQPGSKTHKVFSPADYLKTLACCPVYEITGSVDFLAAARYCAALLPAE